MLSRLTKADFLDVGPGSTQPFDRVLMNPPFAKQADVRHVQHALGFLKKRRAGGLLVAIMARGVRFRTDRLATGFRTLVEDREGRIEDLPDGSFRAAGTDVRTVLVTIPGGT